MPVVAARSVNVTARSARSCLSRGPTPARTARTSDDATRPLNHHRPGFGNEAGGAAVRSRTLRVEVTVVDSTEFDVVIVGGGAAGLSAALVLGRARRRVVVVDGGAPRNAPAAHMQGFLSRDGMPPAELLAAGRAEIAGYGVEVVEDHVRSLEPGFTVRLAGGRVLAARRVLVATGVGDELPDIPGVRERWGRDLLHCPYCHGWEVRDQPLGVLGTHPAAVLHALLVRQWSGDVVLFAHDLDLSTDDRARLDARGIRVEHGQVVRLVVEADRLTGVELADGRVVARTAVFVRPGNVPHPDGLLAGLGCALDADGFPIVDRTGATSAPGVWAAGNVVDPRAQVITSAGMGSAAAIAINADLVQDDVERALRALPAGDALRARTGRG
jgi:thioredoxin reductase